MIAVARPAPTWFLVVVYILAAVEFYFILTPRKWHPWARRQDRKRAERRARLAKWDLEHPTLQRRRQTRLEEARTGDITGEAFDLEIMRIEHDRLVGAGCLDPDEPTPYSHYRWMKRMTAPLSAEDNMMVRSRLGIQ